MSVVNIIRGKVTLQLLNPSLLYVDMTVIFEGQPYSILRTFGNETVEIFNLHVTKTAHLTQLTIPIIDEGGKIYHFDREEVEAIIAQDLFGKTVGFSAHTRMVTAESFSDNGTVRIRGSRPYPLTCAKIIFPQPHKEKVPDMFSPDPATDEPTPRMEEELSFEVTLSKQVIPMGKACGTCPFLHQLSFTYPGYEYRKIKVPYCIFLKQGSVPNGMKEVDLEALGKVLGQSVDDLTEIDTGMLGLQLFANGVKECNINVEDNFEFPL